MEKNVICAGMLDTVEDNIRVGGEAKGREIDKRIRKETLSIFHTR